MELIIQDWISLLLRWLHIITAIAWIGGSLFFIWLDLSLRRKKDMDKNIQGETWMVHGGGFYHAEKWLVAPHDLPKELHWFKYESYFTWISGFLLMAVIYYWGAETYLIDNNVMNLSVPMALGISMLGLYGGWVFYDLLCRSPLGKNTGSLAVSVFVLLVLAAWGYGEVFSARAAFVHVGAMIGTIMTANVFFIIIPNQKKVVNSLTAGEAPDPSLGKQAKQRSTHNNYLTLPVLFMMMSNHYPMTYSAQPNWLVAALVIILGGVIRDYFNATHAGGTGNRVRYQWPLAAVIILALIAITGGKTMFANNDGAVVSDARVMEIMEIHCVTCHAINPTSEFFDTAPLDVTLENKADILKFSTQINAQTILSTAMPLGNESQMSQSERDELRIWLDAQK
jgi:uncharacterized membrane protein